MHFNSVPHSLCVACLIDFRPPVDKQCDKCNVQISIFEFQIHYLIHIYCYRCCCYDKLLVLELRFTCLVAIKANTLLLLSQLALQCLMSSDTIATKLDAIEVSLKMHFKINKVAFVNLKEIFNLYVLYYVYLFICIIIMYYILFIYSNFLNKYFKVSNQFNHVTLLFVCCLNYFTSILLLFIEYV